MKEHNDKIERVPIIFLGEIKMIYKCKMCNEKYRNKKNILKHINKCGERKWE